jgi:hypothetical protein
MSDQVSIPDFAVRTVGALYLKLTVAEERIAQLEQQLQDAQPKTAEPEFHSEGV